MYTYQIKRMRRKSLKLSITPDGEILVEAPLALKKEAIDHFVEKHEDWIGAHLKIAQEQRKALRQPLQVIPLIGKDYLVRRWQQKEICLKGEEIFLPDGWDPAKERQKVIAWYRAQAQGILEKRAAYWAKIMACSYARIRISSARKRWGSCTSEGNIAFSWRLLQAPPQAIDYVIIHELAHLQILDHSPAFWKLVETYCPDYRARKQLLVQTAERMHKQGWDL